MRSPIVLTVLLGLTGAAPALAEGPKIALVAPQSGPYAILGGQMRDGATLAADKLGLELALINESCEAGSGPEIARQIRDSGAKAAIGFLCSESLDGALAPLKDAAIPAITLSVRWRGVMEDALKNGWPLFRMAPSTDDEAKRLSDVILREWSDAALALVEDGTIHGRELAETIRNTLEEKGLKPVFTDTFRPGQEQQLALVRRLKKAGATHVFIGGDRNDVAIIARDALAENAALTLIGGEAMDAADQPVKLADGVYAVALPDYAQRADAAAVVEELKSRGVTAEGYVLPAHAAVNAIAEAAGAASALSLPLAQALGEAHFDTVIGPVAFDEQHELTDNPYRLLMWQNGAFVEVGPASQ